MIDTAEKRRSISGIWLFIPGVTPNAAKDQEWRQESAWGYSGILVALAEIGGIQVLLFSDAQLKSWIFTDKEFL